MKLKILLFFTILICQCATAQRYNFKTFTTKEGLSNNYINDIEKDKKGFLWIGTTNGLNRFDGNYFTKFYHNPKHKNSLPDNTIQKLHIDTEGGLWITHSLGLSHFVEDNQTFENYAIEQPSFSSFDIIDDGDSNIWVASSTGLHIFDRRKKAFIETEWRRFLNHFFKDKDIAEKEAGVVSILRGANDKVWLKTSTYLFEFDRVRKQFKAHPSVLLSSIIGGQIICDDSLNHILYIGSFNMGLTIYNYATNRAENFRTDRNSFHSLTNYDPFYNLKTLPNTTHLFHTDYKIGVWDKTKLTSSLLLTLPTGTQITNWVLQDSINIWLGTTTGLIHVEKDKSHFKKIPDNSMTVKGAFAYVQKADSADMIYFHHAEKNCPVIWNEKTGKAQNLPLAKGIITGFLRYVYKDKKGNVWLSTDYELFCKKNKSPIWQKIDIQHPVRSKEPITIRNLVEDNDGRLWLRVRNVGLYLFNEKTEHFDYQKWLPLSTSPAYADMLFHSYRNSLFVDDETTGILYELSLSTPEMNVSSFSLAEDKSEIIHPQRMALDSQKMIWLNDPRKGLIRYDPYRQVKKIFDADEGLIFNVCENVQSDAQGNIWTNSTEGVTKIIASTGECLSLEYPEFRYIHDVFCDKMGNVYLSTTQGVYKWQSKNIVSDVSKGHLYWDKMVVNNNVFSINDKRHVFNHNDNDITIHFGYLNLNNDDFTSGFEYKMQSDTAWHYLGNQHLLSFSQLSDGQYHLQLRLKNDSNHKNHINLEWEIRPPFWRTWWFVLLSLTAASSIVYFVVKRRINNIKEQARIKQKLVETEMMALRAQMNPHFIFNCISSIDNFILDNDKENASVWLNKFAKLIRGVLDNSKNDVIPFWKDWEILRLYIELEQLRSDNKFNFTMNADPELLEGHYRIPPLIVQPFIENAIHHGLMPRFDKEGKLSVSAALSDHFLYFIIEDNGIGREKAQELKAINRLDHNSYGLKMSRDRIDLFNTNFENAIIFHDLVDENGVAIGTKVEITLIV